MTLTIALYQRFDDFTLDASFAVPAGLTALFGRSGAGKTSVINAVAGLLRPQRGRVELDGRALLDTEARIEIPVHRRRIGYVFQEARLFPHLSVRQNLNYARRFGGRSGAADFDHIVDMLGVGDLLLRRPATLSGGEKQRVAIGRALLANPDLLLLDEPLAALDDRRKAEILPYFETLRDGLAIPILYVSHSITEVVRLATTLVVLDQGRVIAAGPLAAVLSDPKAVPGIGANQAGAVLQAVLSAQDPDGLTRLETEGGPLWLPRIDRPLATRLSIRVAAQDVILSRDRPSGLSALNILQAHVTSLTPIGDTGTLVQVAVGGDLLLAQITNRSAQSLGLQPGTPVFAILKSVSVAQSSLGSF